MLMCEVLSLVWHDIPPLNSVRGAYIVADISVIVPVNVTLSAASNVAFD